MKYQLQTLKNFYDNPMGKGSTAIPNRKITIDFMESKYYRLTNKKDITCRVYIHEEFYYFHLLIPSDSDDLNIHYDVVIKFCPANKHSKFDNFLNNYYVKFFSNCPSFTYTFAYVYMNNGLLIDELKGRYRDEVLTQKPNIRNRSGLINYDKSIFYACKYILDHKHLLNKMRLQSEQVRKPIEFLFKNIRNTDKIELEYAKENKKVRKEKKDNNVIIKTTERKTLPTTIPKVQKVGKITGRKKITAKKSTKTTRR